MLILKRLTIVLAWVTVLATAAAAKDLASMSPAEISGLQRRLTDAKCYAGMIDGKASPSLDQAIKTCPDQEPVLRIETGVHTARIGQFGLDAVCTVMATGSEDKTVRLWSMPDGKLIETLRLPIGPGNGGRIDVTAVSPDGRFVAAGGRDAAWEKLGGMGVYLYDRQSHAIRRIAQFESDIDALAFSSDGLRLVVGLSGDKGLHLVDVTSAREVGADLNYHGDIYGLAFGADGSLWSTSYDGYVRRYSRDLKLQAKIKAPEGERPFGLALDPSGKRIIVGYNDGPAVSILEALTLTIIGKADVTGMTKGNLRRVVWDPTGTAFSAAGQATTKIDHKSQWILRRFASDGSVISTNVPVIDDTITGIGPCGSRIVFASLNATVGLIDQNGKTTILQTSHAADMRGKLDFALAVGHDGRSVRFGLGIGGYSPVLFNLPEATVTDEFLVSTELIAPRLDGLDIKHWNYNKYPTILGNPIPLETREKSRALAIRPDAAGFVLGTEWYIRAFDAKGNQRWQRETPSGLRGVNFDQDGKLVIVAVIDGTIRWYRWSDGKELLALFVDKATRKWVAWTPSGYYLASPGGEDLIGWQVNRGWAQLADFYPAARFRDGYARPDIVQKVLITLDEDEAVKQANAEHHQKGDRKPIATQLPPVITIVEPSSGHRFSAESVKFEYVIRSPSNLKISGLEILVDGRPADAQRGLGNIEAEQSTVCPGIDGDTRSPTDATVFCHLSIKLPRHDVDVALVARAGDKVSEPARIHLIYDGKPPELDAVLKPKLYVLAVGISSYVDPNLQLGLPAKDAHDFADAFQHQEGGLYGKVTVKILADRDATRDTVLEGFEWLERQVTSHDIGIVFLAGHGIIDRSGEFWFLPHDATPETLRTRGISKEDIQGSLARLAGKAILFLDACHAAGMIGGKARGLVDINGVINEFSASENGVVVFGSSTGREVSLENLAWGNGAFTKAVVEGIGAGRADLLHKGVITLSELDVYVADRVKELTDGLQHPVMNKPGTIPNFPIGTAR